jgi:hypothetical protein
MDDDFPFSWEWNVIILIIPTGGLTPSFFRGVGGEKPPDSGQSLGVSLRP